MDLINVRSKWWITVTNHCNYHTLPSHKLKGRVANNKRKWNDMFESDLIDHRKEAGPIATQFVREFTGELSERDDTNKEAEYLSPHWSKRQCYYKFCASMGVEVKSNSKGNVLMLMMPRAEENKVENNDDDDDSSSTSTTIGELGDNLQASACVPPSWKSYRRFWSTNYPNLKVSRPAEDICSYCYKFHNRFRYKQRTNHH